MRQRQRRTTAKARSGTQRRTAPRARPGPLPRLLATLLTVVAAAVSSTAATSSVAAASAPRPLGQLVPAPAQVVPGGSPYAITSTTPVRVPGGSAEVRRIGTYLAELLRPATGYALPVTDRPGPGGIRLELGSRDRSLGEEGYRLRSTPTALTITARAPAGLFHGVQTLRQLLPDRVEADSRQKGPWKVAGGTVTDAPRYGYRGAMLDVSRHFFSVAEVKRYIDQLALYKVNKLHLHLSDDQGWRIAIDSWPRLATYGGSTEVGGGPGGYYTKAQYREIVRYAASRYLEVVPEIDLPGHTNAALASYAELNCDGVAPPLYTGTTVGFSSLCVPKPVTYDFVDDVLREVAALTPGKYLHIGGDEAHATSHEDYVAFMAKAQAVVGKYGRTVMGWHQLTGAVPVKGAVVQYWGYDRTGAAERKQVADAAKGGTKLVLSPADRVYLDMKYTKDTPLGLSWAGLVEVRRSYDWDPGTYLEGAPQEAVLGVEAPIWTETLTDSTEIEKMAFPRLLGAAEIGWSPAAARDWETYKVRLAAQGPRLTGLGIDFYRSPQVDWGP
ncbi:beta-N-acetylhexosaminidase [Streptomyces cyaneofuscatus]|uniref:beta-N-acetylhexosaminidase n=1 Tax=Streptomyces cyaneofuscatus TaxID=66883 RepID=UPI0036479BF9